MKKNHFLLLLFFPLFAFCQEKKFYELGYKGEPYYKETSKFFKDTIWRFNQMVAYDKPDANDEETWVRLVIEVKDTTAFLEHKRIDLEKDSSIAISHFSAWNVWDFNRDPTSITGHIDLISLTKNEITLGFDLTVTNLKTNIQFIYKGERTFSQVGSIKEFF